MDKLHDASIESHRKGASSLEPEGIVSSSFSPICPTKAHFQRSSNQVFHQISTNLLSHEVSSTYRVTVCLREYLINSHGAIAVQNGGSKVSDDISNLPPQVQERLLRLQQLQQTLQSVLAQKQQVELELSEIGQATKELEKLNDDAIIYKTTGSLMIKAEKAKVNADLNERKDLLSARASVLAKQEERLRSQLKDLQTKLQQDLSPVSLSSQP